MRFAPNKSLFKSISFRMAFLFCVTFTVGIALAFAIIYFVIGYSLESSNRQVLSAKGHEASTMLADEGVPGIEKYFAVDENRLNNAAFMIRVLDASGNQIYLKPSTQTKSFDFESEFKAHGVPVTGWRSLPAIDDEDRFDILTEKLGQDRFLQIGKSSEDREAILGQLLDIFAITGGALILLSGALGFWFANYTLRPLRSLISAIREIENGDMSRRVESGSGRHELSELAHTFNRMIGRIDSLVRGMRESLDHVAHDIRTPLTRIRAITEDAMISKQPTSMQEALEDCAESASAIAEIVEQVMSISEANSGTMILKREPCPILDLLEEITELYEFVAQEKSIALSVQVEPKDLTWSLDRKRCKQIVANLVDNALKFSEPDGEVSVRAQISNSCLLIEVVDKGCGISAQDLPQIWERLFRGDRSRTTRGAGLGLSIVRAIAQAHGGEVSARPNVSQGTIFTVSIPSI